MGHKWYLWHAGTTRIPINGQCFAKNVSGAGTQRRRTENMYLLPKGSFRGAVASVV